MSADQDGPWLEFAAGMLAAAGRVDGQLGHEQIVRQVLARLEAVLVERDVDYPALRRSADPWRKIGGDNPDAIYASCPIDGRTMYRIHGRRGNADVVTVTVTRGAAAFVAGVAGVIANHVVTDDDVDIALNDLPADAAMVMVRQFFGDWSSAEPASLVIERTGSEVGATNPDLADLIGAAGRGVERSVARFAALWEGLLERRNRLEPVIDQAERTATPGGIALAGTWDVPRGRAAVIEFTPPQCRYWNVQLGTPWHTSIDYRRYRSCANHTQTPPDPDGRVRLVIAHDDPGYVNWLAPGSLETGVIGMRVVGADVSPVVSITLADPADLRLAGARCDAAARAVEMRERRLAVDRRFRA